MRLSGFGAARLWQLSPQRMDADDWSAADGWLLLALQPHIGKLTLNYYTGKPHLTSCGQLAPKVHCTNVTGMKALFWKAMFTPERVAYFTHIWLFDSDVEVYPFALPQLIDVMRALGAAIGQPAIAKPSSFPLLYI